MKCNLWMLFGMVCLVGCLDVGEEPDAERLGVSESGLCLAPTVPGTPSQSRTVTEHGTQVMDASNYGTSECSRITLELKTTLTADAMVTGTTTQATCEGTRVFGTYFYAEPTGSQNWVRDQIISRTGTWENNSCNRIPLVAYDAPATRVALPVPPYHEYQHLPRDVRMVVSAQRTLCTQGPSGLELCSTTYGLPLHAVGYQRP